MLLCFINSKLELIIRILKTTLKKMVLYNEILGSKILMFFYVIGFLIMTNTMNNY